MAAKELLAPVPSAADYSVSAELWGRLEKEIMDVSARIDAGEELVPEDVANIRKLKAQVDGYLTDFNRAMRDSQAKYKKMVEAMLKEIHFDVIEDFVSKKRREQGAVCDSRIGYKMACLKEISDGLLARTARLKDVPLSGELLPAFTARFPKVQSGAKGNDIKDWMPYFTVMHKTVALLDAFFCDPKYEDAALLPIHSGTMRELLAYVRDGSQEHLTNVPARFEEDEPLIGEEKLRRELVSEEAAIEHIKGVLGALDGDGSKDGINRAWKEISRIVRLYNKEPKF